MSIRKLRAGRVPTATISNYIGERGAIFYDEITAQLKISDGHTPGGNFINLVLSSENQIGGIKPGSGFQVSGDGTLNLLHTSSFFIDNSKKLSLAAGTTAQIGGIKSGNGIIIASDGTVSLDSSGLSFSFGDFYAFTNTGQADGACISSVNTNQDINIVSNGTGTINIIGEFNIHKTNETLEDALNLPPVFAVDVNGDVSSTTMNIVNSGLLGLRAPLNVSINGQGLTKTPAVITGAVAQFTGRDNNAPIIVLDSYGIDSTRTITGGEITFRTGRGTNDTTTSIQSGDRLGQLTAAGWASNGYGGIGVGGLKIVANENYTSTARGSRLELFVTPNTTLNQITVATIDNNGITLNNGNLIGNISGSAPAGSLTGTTLASNVVSSSLTSIGTLTNLVVGGTIRYDGGQNNAIASGFNKTGGTVTANGRTGQLTTNSDLLAKGTAGTFTVSNNFITSAKDVVIVNLASGGTVNSYAVAVTHIQASGSFNITVHNNGSGPLSEALVINFAVIKVS